MLLGVQKAKTGKPAAEVPERLRMCLRGWVLLKLSGDDASGCAAPTPQAVPKQEEEKRKCAGTRKGNLYFLQCPSNTLHVCAVQSLCMPFASCKEDMLIGASCMITEQAVEGVFGAKRQ